MGRGSATGSWHGEITLWNTSEWVQTLRPQTLEKISGDNQQGTLSAVLANPYVVEVRDQQGNPLQGAQVTFTVDAGDGKLSGRFSVENVTTDANGGHRVHSGWVQMRGQISLEHLSVRWKCSLTRQVLKRLLHLS